MKFNEDMETGQYQLKSYGDGWIQVNEKRLETGFILGPSALIEDGLPNRYDELRPEHLQQLFTQPAEIILVGTGKTQALPKPDIYRAFVSNRCGFEFMTTAAACRTYKVLNAESRAVFALLFPA